ncbi:MAG: TonB-dependent receptor domain-containing protein [Bacteroidota bacterium]
MKNKITGIILVLTIIFGAQELLAQQADTTSIWVNGLCGMCKTRIEKTAMSTPGVQSAVWDDVSKTLSISYDHRSFDLMKLHENIAAVGHDTRLKKAPDDVYEALPACCKYREHATHEEAGGGKKGMVTGYVYETDSRGRKLPLPGANVYWVGSKKGTISDEKGVFSLPMEAEAHMLVLSYVGYGSDTLHVHEPSDLEFGFKKTRTLDEVKIVYRIKPTTFSFDSPYHIQEMNQKELTKAACCNLSESFETNPAVDVSYTDAVTGTRQIELLGLAGPYVQITRENMPDVRGLSSLFGLTYTPGPWIEGIQLNMGTGSVVNGYEGISGQINVELKKPEEGERFYFNLYGNDAGRTEASANVALRFNEHLSTAFLLHGNYLPFKMDRNGDGFLDHQTGSQFIGINRWKFHNEKGLEGIAGVKMTWLDNTGGQLAFDPSVDRDAQAAWGSGNLTKRMEGWLKIGTVFPDHPYSSVGFQLSGMVHDQQAFFGRRDYNAVQQSLYANLIYQGIFSNTNHKFRTGASFQLDHYDENVSGSAFERLESVPGTFFEYTYSYLEKFNAVAGLRADYHNLYGVFLTPSLHLRYALKEKSVFRASLGRGLKTASVFAENIGMFASSRNIVLPVSGGTGPYGLKPEIAWTAGVSFSQGFPLGGNDGVFNIDYYNTRFNNQVVVDYDSDPRQVSFYNLQGESWSHSLQARIDLEPLPRFEIRAAYRLNDVRTTYGDQLLEKPLLSRNRAFINLAYATEGGWKADLTWNYQGPKRLPYTGSNPEAYQLPERSPGYQIVNLQVTKSFKDKVELYAGAENLFDFRQEDPILSADDPFSDYFDASMVWGPIFGRKIYAGLRWKIA